MADIYQDQQAGTFDFGRALSRTFTIIGDNFKTLFLLTFLLAGLPSLLINTLPYFIGSGAISGGNALWLSIFDFDNLNGSSVLLMVVTVFGFLLVYLLAYATLQGAVFHTCMRDYDGIPANVSESLAVGWSRVWPMLGFVILWSFGIGFGILFFLIPGLMLMCIWFVGGPTITEEGEGVFGAFARSSELTRGYRWWLLLAVVIYFIAALFFGAIIGLVAGVAVGFDTISDEVSPTGTFAILGYGVFNMAIDMITNLIGIVGTASFFLELRGAKEGHASGLADIFD